MFKGNIWPNKYVIESVEYYKMEPFVCWALWSESVDPKIYKSKLEDKIEWGLFSHSTGG